MLLRALLIAGAVAVAAPALAQTQNQPQMSPGQKVINACGPDIQNFCSGVTPGQGRIAACLRPHMRELSPECKGSLVEARARRQQQQQP